MIAQRLKLRIGAQLPLSSEIALMLDTNTMCRCGLTTHPRKLRLNTLQVNIHTDTLNESGFVESKHI